MVAEPTAAASLSPVGVDDAVSTVEDLPITIDVLANDRRTIVVDFDSHWRPFDEQTGQVLIALDGGPAVEFLRFDDLTTTDVDQRNQSISLLVSAPAAAETLAASWRISDADNDWYWAIDNVAIAEGDGAALLTESFDDLASALQPAVDELIDPSLLGWTRTTPTGWSIDTPETVPQGTTEWRGWTFATPAFWTAADMQARDEFTLGTGVIAIADPDEWDDFNGGSVLGDDFESTLSTPALALAPGLAITSLTQGANGTVAIGTDGLVYAPNADFSGVDTFDYAFIDQAGRTGSASVTVTVTAENDAPAPTNDAFSLLPDTPLIGDVSLNDVDADGDALVYTLVSDVSSGTLVFANDGAFVYTPAPGFVGTDSFAVSVSDGALSTFATAILTVAAADPTIIGDDGDNLLEGDAADNVMDGRGGDDIVIGRDGDDVMNGGDGDDILRGSAGDDAMFGDAGVDIVRGGRGDDVIEGGDGGVAGAPQIVSGDRGRDEVFGGDGVDIVRGGADDDRLFGGGGDDRVVGDRGDDLANGGDGADTVVGARGDDVIDGGAGNDTLVGDLVGATGALSGGGADIFTFQVGGGRDVVRDFEDGVDRLDVRGFAFDDVDAVIAEVQSAPSGGVLVRLGDGDAIVLRGLEVADIAADDFIFV